MIPPVPTSASYDYDEVGKLAWQESTEDIRLETRATTPYENNNEIPPHVAYAIKALSVQGGVPYQYNLHVKEINADMQFGVVFIMSKSALEEKKFGIFNSDYGIFGQYMFTDTGMHSLSFTSDITQDVVALLGFASNDSGSIVLDDVGLTTGTLTNYLTEAFDAGITPWRSSALLPIENPPMALGTVSWEADSGRLKITQGDVEIEGESTWLGAAARRLPAQSYKQYEVSVDVLEDLANTIDFSNIAMASLNIYDADEFAAGGPMGTQPIAQIPITQYGTVSSGLFRSKQGNLTAMVVLMSGKTQQANAGVFYIDNLTMSLVENSISYTCDASTPSTQLSVSGYRFGFNGMEKDDEVKGSGNSYTTEFRGYDARLCRWFSTDPKYYKFPNHSPYSAMGNNPLTITDKKGDVLNILGGFALGLTIDIAGQMLANSLTGKELLDIDWGDAIISGAIGAATSGMSALNGVSLAQKLETAALTMAESAGISSKVAKVAFATTSIVTEEGIKSTIDVKVTYENGDGISVNMNSIYVDKNSENYKDKTDAAVDFAVGTVFSVTKGMVTTTTTKFATKTLNEEQAMLMRQVKKTALGSKNNLKYKLQLQKIGENIEMEEKISEVTNDIIGESSESIVEPKKEKIKGRINLNEK